MKLGLFRGRATLGFRTVFLLLLSLSLMYLDHSKQVLAPFRQSLSLVVAPVQYVVDAPWQFVGWLDTNLTSRHHLIEQNAAYQEQLLIYKARLQHLLAVEKENSQLRALLKSSPKARGSVLVAEILSVSNSQFNSQMVLNQGTEKGVYQGQPVFDASGVFGQVSSTGPITSRVLLLTDSQSAVPVQVMRNGIRAIAVGMGNNAQLQLIHVPITADIKVGDSLVTSGLGQRFPEGYPVGTVSAITHKPGNHFATIYVKPKAHFDSSRLVLLVWPKIDKVAA